ncbi:uncharacterized protein LOC107010597 [Solanum pennellii]|uniref:Uncharacterized protein LOC107010597 n=1 Tax=Solanum pennellii TaxID=28526 RepID=A0ABM1G384_SOLPN|nr:uncharacterized protein LOC107010597 [Solanum pennellii]
MRAQQLFSVNVGNICGPRLLPVDLMRSLFPSWTMHDTRIDCYIEIVAPYVQHLKISGDFVGVEVRLGHLSSLIQAHLTYELYDFRVSGEVIDKSIACANELIIPSWYIKQWCEHMDVLEHNYENIFIRSLQNLKT